ncbi:MAG: 30S ribosome-binding factor RbfA [Succiniclasticum sp.]|jgi:ribosome-binding factor A
MARLRVEKVQEQIQHEISNMLLRDVKDPRIKAVTVTGVELTDDMSQAKVFVSLYGPADKQQEAWDALNRAKGYLRTEIAKRIRLRFAPEILLEKDTSLEYGAHIDSLLRQIKESENK